MNKCVPFSAILLPFVEQALKELTASLSAQIRLLLKSSAFDDMATGLLEELSFVSYHALYHDYCLFIARDPNRIASHRFSRLTNDSTADLYKKFIKECLSDEQKSSCKKDSLLGRLIQRRINYWIKNANAVILAVINDLSEINRLISFPLSNSNPISRVVLNLSDSHDSGKTVVILELESGHRIVYKPRDVKLELQFMRLLDLLNQAKGEPIFRAVKMLPKNNYGWCEFIKHSQTADSHEIQTFYVRLGYLLAVLYVFRATDCHYENLIASGGFPVAIDLETLCQPGHDLFSDANPDDLAYAWLHRSAIRVGILPVVDEQAPEGDPSVLGAVLDPPRGVVRKFTDNISDNMALSDVAVKVFDLKCNPTTVELKKSDLLGTIRTGFSEGYDLLLCERSTILKHLDLLRSLRNLKCRYVLRPTKAYYFMLQNSLDGKALKSRQAREGLFSPLFRMSNAITHRTAWKKIATQERASLRNLDIPHFSVPLTGRSLYSARKKLIARVFKKSPLSLIKERVLKLSKSDLQHQLHLIDLSFGQRQHPGMLPNVTTEVFAVSKITIDALVSSATALAERIWDLGVPLRKGNKYWVTLRPTSNIGLNKIEVSGAGLYQGNAGIGLFFAAMYAIKREKKYLDWSRAILISIDTGFQDQERFDIGDGRLGVAYSLYRSGKLIGDAELIAKGTDLVALLSPSIIPRIQSVDVMGGLAGLLLVATSIAKDAMNTNLKLLIQKAADEILNRAVEVDRSCLAWKTFNECLLPGFAHGSSGISYALARAGSHLNKPLYLEAARKAAIHEQYVFNHDKKNWIDLRSSDNKHMTGCSWCHGAIGIGLANKELEKLIGTSRRKTVDCAYSVMINEINKNDFANSLCCGMTGAIDLILASDEDSTPMLNRLLASLCTRAKYRFQSGGDTCPFLPGLFNGGAGVGYMLLRAAFPTVLPSILTFE